MDMNLECWKSSHLVWSLGLGIPMLVVWIVLMPLLALFFLTKNRGKLDHIHVKMKYLILY